MFALREMGRTLKAGAPPAVMTFYAGDRGILKYRWIREHVEQDHGAHIFEIPEREGYLAKAGFEDFQPETCGGNSLVVTFVLAVLGGTLLVLVLIPLARRAHLSRPALTAVLWFVLFMVEYVIGIVEMPFFTTYPKQHMTALAMQGAIVSLVAAGLSSWLLPSLPAVASLRRRLGSLLSQRRWHAWVVRFALCGLAYLVLYLVVGGISYLAFTQPYYTDPTLAAQLHLKDPPNFGVIVPLEIGRGMLFALALLPVIAVVGMGRRRLAIWSSTLLFVIGDLVPMLQGQNLPVALRLYTGVEIFFQNFPLGIVIAHLLGPRRQSENSLPDTFLS